MSLLLVMPMVLSDSGTPQQSPSWPLLMGTRRLSPRLLLTNGELDLHLVHKILTSLCGMSLGKLVFIGQKLASFHLKLMEYKYLRLRGHRDQITSIRFLSSSRDLPSTSTSIAPGYLLTSGKDTFVKFWDLSTQHCVQTIVAHRSEVWSLDINWKQESFFTGSGDGEVKAWKIDSESLARGLKETETGEVCPLSPWNAFRR